LFSEHSDEKFAVESGSCTLLVRLGQVAKLGEGLQSIQSQFDLPADPVPLKDQSHTKSAWRKRRRDHDGFRILQRIGSEDLPALGDGAAELAFEEERRRTKVIPHLLGAGSVVKLVLAVLIRVSERWGKKCFSEFAQHQIRRLRRQFQLDLPDVQRPEPTAAPTRRSATSAA